MRLTRQAGKSASRRVLLPGLVEPTADSDSVEKFLGAATGAVQGKGWSGCSAGEGMDGYAHRPQCCSCHPKVECLWQFLVAPIKFLEHHSRLLPDALRERIHKRTPYPN